jgi:hypothetical protein
MEEESILLAIADDYRWILPNWDTAACAACGVSLFAGCFRRILLAVFGSVPVSKHFVFPWTIQER